MGSGLPPGTDLPAPYESPWRRLGSDLRDVVASLRLRLWGTYGGAGTGSMRLGRTLNRPPRCQA